MIFAALSLAWFLAAPTVAPDFSGFVSLFSYRGIARGCPIGETTLLTARHVAIIEREGFGSTAGAMVWSDGTGASGSAWTLDYDLRRDVAIMQSDQPFGRPYRLATKAPQIGDAVVLAGYKFTEKLELKTLRTRIVNIVAAHLVLADGAEHGFSGSCVLDAKNDVVGIFHWSLERDGNERGIASGVWPPFGSVGWLPPEKEAR